MNRNNFLPHVALALVIVLIAAFAGQVRKWRNDWHAHEGGVKTRLEARVDSEAHRRGQDRVKKGRELFVRFRPGVSNEQIQAITGRLHDRIEDQIESVSGLDLIEDDQGTDVATLL